MPLLVIARLTISEAARRRILIWAFLLGVAFLVLYGAGVYLLLHESPFRGSPAHANPVIRRQALNFLLVIGLYAVNFLTVMMTVLTSVDTLAGEIASGTIQSVVTKPVPRWQVVLGKWAGFVVMLTLYILLMAGGVAAVIYLFGGHAAPRLPRAIGLMWLESMLLLSVTLLAGTTLSTLTTGVLAFGLHGLAFLGGWIEEFGWLAKSQTAVNIGILASIIMPSEALWRRAAFDLQTPIIGGFGRTPFSTGSVPSAAMVLYAAAYLLGALALAIRRFNTRDL